MKRREKQILGNSNISNISPSQTWKPEKGQVEHLSLQISILTRENSYLKEENAKLKDQNQKFHKFFECDPKKLMEKFTDLLKENEELKESYSKLKEELLLKNNNKNESTLNDQKTLNRSKKENLLSWNDQKLIETFNSMEQISNFFKEELKVISDKLTKKQKDYDELYLKYISDGEKIYQFMQENEKLKKENRRLKEETL